MESFNPDIDFEYNPTINKFQVVGKWPKDGVTGKTFCITNPLLWQLKSVENCYIHENNTPDDLIWGYIHNILFLEVDVHPSDEMWLMRVIGFLP